MATQGVRGNIYGNTYENPQTVQFSAHENVQVRENEKPAKSQKHEQEIASSGKTSQIKIALVVCFILTIACVIATIVLFTKVMYNKQDTQYSTLSTNFNVTSLEKKVNMTLSEVGAGLNDIDNSISKLRKLLPVKSCAQTSMNGVYNLTTGEKVYCSNGWTVFQRRMDGSTPDFHNKTWEYYSQGFGTLTGEFWFGLRKLNRITSMGGCKLRVDLRSWYNETAFAEYSHFFVNDESKLFRLSVEGYHGTAGDSLVHHNGMAFTTNDRDNDIWNGNCAVTYHGGGWWANGCCNSAPNGIYGETRPRNEGTMWRPFRNYDAMKFIQMAFRCD